ncbi:MAG: hypothetical protein QXT77_07565 [Candidatus Methanomethylicaceae archaeon]
MPCRINRRRAWAWRIFLETHSHDASIFVTLTYNDAHLPPGGTLVPEDYRNFLKRLRRYVEPRRFRFFCVGEYGEQTERPHFHLCLFGLDFGDRSNVVRAWSDRGDPIGFVHIGDVTLDSAQYCAGYVVKKLTSKSDPRLNGRHPEFARMSLRPGIGAPAMAILAKQLKRYKDVAMTEHGDVPLTLKIGKKDFPVHKYLRERLRKEMEFDDDYKKEVKSLVRYEESLELQSMLQSKIAADPRSTATQKSVYLELKAQSFRNVENRAKIFDKGRKL